MSEENKNPNNISIVEGNGLEISEVKDNLSFENHKDKPNKNNIVIPVTQGQIDTNEVPEKEVKQESNETPVSNNTNDTDDDFVVSDASASGPQGQAQNTDTDDDEFDNILNNQDNQ